MGRLYRSNTLIRVGFIALLLMDPGKVAAQPAQPKPPTSSASASREIVGTVLALDGDDLIVDLGTDRGAIEGALVEIWRPLKLKHPVTGLIISDRFRIGSLQLGQVRKSMSLAIKHGELSRAPERGDVVILVLAPEAGTQPAEGTTPTPVVAPVVVAKEDAEARAMATMMDSLKGADLVTRIRKYEDYVRSQPTGRFARVLYEEASALRQLVTGDKVPREQPRDLKAEVEDNPEARSFRRTNAVLAGTALRIAIEVTDATKGAVLHVRHVGEPAYQSMPMTEAGNGYFAATVSGEQLKAPKVEYFIEGTTSKGKARALVASAEFPESVTVHDIPKPTAPPKLDATVELTSDYADYNRFKGNDRIWQTEGYFGIRYGDTGVRALRTGFGVYRGVGGGITELDEEGLNPREVGLTYGYLESELGVAKSFSFIGRAAVGLLEDGVSGGAQLLLRIGNDLGTNLVLGGEILGGVGLRSIAQLELASFERFPIVLRSEVTNQPAGAAPTGDQRGDPSIAQAGGEVGVRGIAQVGVKIVPPLTLAVRGSFQGRTIKHAGPGFGGALGYTW